MPSRLPLTRLHRMSCLPKTRRQPNPRRISQPLKTRLPNPPPSLRRNRRPPKFRRLTQPQNPRRNRLWFRLKRPAHPLSRPQGPQRNRFLPPRKRLLRR